MPYKNAICVMLTFIISMSCFIGISIYAAPTIQKIGMSPASTDILAGSEAIALTVKASGTKLTYEWMLQGQGTLQEPTTKPAVFYIPPEKLNVESVQVMVSIIVKDEQGEEATESIYLKIIGNSASIPVPDRTVQSMPTIRLEESTQQGKLIFDEDFEKGKESLKGWEKTMDTEKIEIVDCGQYGNCLKISRQDRNGITILTKKFQKLTGTLYIEAMIRAENVIKGTAEFASGKFNVVVEKPGNTDWRRSQFYANDFEDTFDWTLKTAEVVDLDGTKDVKIVVGLQSSKGAVYVDDIKVYHLP